MYLAIIHWAYQDDTKARLDIVRLEGEWDGRADYLRRDLVRATSQSVGQFFTELGITPAEAKELIPGSCIRLRNEKENDPRLHTLEGWKMIEAQSLSMSAQDFQALANRVEMPVVLLGTVDKYPQTPAFYGKAEPFAA
jgi:hypothetical protein